MDKAINWPSKTSLATPEALRELGASYRAHADELIAKAEYLEAKATKKEREIAKRREAKIAAQEGDAGA